MLEQIKMKYMYDNFEVKDYKKREDYHLDFDEIAKVLLNRTKLISKNNSYRIREIEFYYYSSYHLDIYCHKNKRQLTSLRLYFHRFKDPKKYIRLKQKGMDITIGKGSSVYGGILIRTVENIKTKVIYTGIGNLSNQIIKDIGGTVYIQELYNSDKNIFESSPLIYLEECSENELKIFKKNRQGLKLKNGDSDRFYLNSKYNYFTYPEIEELK
jgi:hypothetical protein